MRPTTAALLIVACFIAGAHAQITAPTGPMPQRVDVTPATAEAEVGQTLSFGAIGVAQDGSGMDAKPSRWLTAPSIPRPQTRMAP